jgi:glycosyltransferase involved in cell wall biosynthesis
VIRDGLSSPIPAFDRLFTAHKLFQISNAHFRLTGRFVRVRVPSPPAIMHWTYPIPVHLEGAHNVYTLHDLVPLRLPYASTEDKRYYDDLIRKCLDTAALICTVSESSRNDILSLFPIDPGRVVNTYQPVDIPERLLDLTELEKRLSRLFDLRPGGYFLFFGAIEPKKNVGRLIEAYLSSEVETPLVIVGAGGWNADRELRLLRGAHGTSLSAGRNIRMLEYLPRPLLMELVQGARAVLFPSLYEGFGLPALEALALGAPLLTSSQSALPEIVGDAALKVDPYDVAAIAANMRRLDGDAALRTRLAAAGPIQARSFSPQRYRQRIKQMYGRLPVDHNGPIR